MAEISINLATTAKTGGQNELHFEAAALARHVPLNPPVEPMRPSVTSLKSRRNQAKKARLLFSGRVEYASVSVPVSLCFKKLLCRLSEMHLVSSSKHHKGVVDYLHQPEKLEE